MIDLRKLELWFITGSQHLYGEQTLNQVAADAQMRFYALGARLGLGLRPTLLTVDCVVVGERVSAAFDPSGEEALIADAMRVE